MHRLLIPLAGLLASVATAHELHDNRVTVVLHQQHSINLVLRLDFAGLLQHIVATDLTPAEFLALVATQAPEQLNEGMSRLKREVEQGLVLTSSGQPLVISDWQWPPTTAIHAALREQMMAILVHAEPSVEDPGLEVHANAFDPLAVKRVSLDLPELLKPAVVLWYRPQQVMASPGSAIQSLDFSL